MSSVEVGGRARGGSGNFGDAMVPHNNRVWIKKVKRVLYATYLVS